MVEIVLVKRKAREGEIGLFCDAAPFREEWESLKIGEEVKADCVVPANLRYLKFFWALMGKIVDNTPDRFLDKRDCADQVLLEARHFKAIHDPLRDKTELKPKSISGLSGDTWLRLLRRVTHVVLTQYLPGVEESTLKAEIATMLGVDVFSPETKSHPRGGEPSAPSAAAQQTPEPTAERTGPQNEAEYISACRGWLTKQPDRFKALNYFEGDVHKETRKRLKVSQGVYKMLHREIQEHFNAKEPTK